MEVKDKKNHESVESVEGKLQEFNYRTNKLIKSLTIKKDVHKFLIFENTSKIRQSMAQKRIEKEQSMQSGKLAFNNIITERSISDTSQITKKYSSNGNKQSG